MNKKYERYIEYIANDIKPPYIHNMRDMYGLRPDEYSLVLSKVYNQPVRVSATDVYNTNGNEIYREYSTGFWYRYEYNDQGKRTYYEDSDGYWYKNEWDSNGNLIYTEDSNGYWAKTEYDANGNLIYHEDSDGVIIDNR